MCNLDYARKPAYHYCWLCGSVVLLPDLTTPGWIVFIITHGEDGSDARGGHIHVACRSVCEFWLVKIVLDCLIARYREVQSWISGVISLYLKTCIPIPKAHAHAVSWQTLDFMQHCAYCSLLCSSTDHHVNYTFLMNQRMCNIWTPLKSTVYVKFYGTCQC